MRTLLILSLRSQHFLARNTAAERNLKRAKIGTEIRGNLHKKRAFLTLKMAQKAVISNPLASFVRLSNGIYLREAASPTHEVSSTDTKENTHPHRYPSTILLFFWAGAAPRVLVKYVAQYAELAPSSRIIFMLTSWSDIFQHSPRILQRRRLIPAIKALLTPVNGSSVVSMPPVPHSNDNPVFIHAFSNGGLFTLGHFLVTYRQVTGGHHALPVSSMILDSVPSNPTISDSAKALSISMPKNIILRTISMGIAYGFLLTFWILRKLSIGTDPVEFARKAINNSTLITPAGDLMIDDNWDKAEEEKNDIVNRKVLRRCYIYSDADDLIPVRDVDDHIRQSALNDWIVIDKEFFIGSPHVGHMRADPVRYWAIVKRYLDLSFPLHEGEAGKDIAVSVQGSVIEKR